MGDNKSAQQPDVNEQIKVRMEKLKNLQDAGKDPFQITKYDVTHHTDEIRAIYEAHEKELLGDRPAVNTEGLDEQQAREAVTADYNERRAIMDASPINVSFAGRMMFKRVMGKASFCNIADLKGRMQAYISRDAIGEEAYADFKKSDIGDIFGIKGFIFRTKTGEISVHAEEITLLSKSLQVLPEKFHGQARFLADLAHGGMPVRFVRVDLAFRPAPVVVFRAMHDAQFDAVEYVVRCGWAVGLRRVRGGSRVRCAGCCRGLAVRIRGVRDDGAIGGNIGFH